MEGILRTGCVVDGALYGVHGGVPEGAAGGKACVSYGALYGAVTEGGTPYTVRMTRSLYGMGL